MSNIKKHEYDVEENFVVEEISTKETQGSRFLDLFSPTLFLLCTLRYNKCSFFICLKIKEGCTLSCFSPMGDVHALLNSCVKENKLTEKLFFRCIRTLLHTYSELKWTESSAVMDWTSTLQKAEVLKFGRHKATILRKANVR